MIYCLDDFFPILLYVSRSRFFFLINEVIIDEGCLLHMKHCYHCFVLHRCIVNILPALLVLKGLWSCQFPVRKLSFQLIKVFLGSLAHFCWESCTKHLFNAICLFKSYWLESGLNKSELQLHTRANLGLMRRKPPVGLALLICRWHKHTASHNRH